MGTDHVHAIGSPVWVLTAEDTWLKGTVTKLHDSTVEVTVKQEDGQEVKIKSEKCPLRNVGRPVEDMTTLNYLNEPGVLNNLRDRYQLDDIYTYTGTILIAINPFQNLAHLYGPQMMLEYKDVDLGELSPHVYAIADNAFRQMCKANRSQSILVSGESGAGKTETSKLIMNYLAWMGGRVDGDSSERSVEQKILESNPLLEAFGNAKTVRNDNSSRFGKFVEIQFNKDWRISGAAIRTYLLERSRLVSINDPERNYHIFYQLCDGAKDELKTELFLKPAREFKYLNQSTCFELNGVDNAKDFKRTKHAMKIVGISNQEQHDVFKTIAAVLHLGNIVFSEGSEPDSSKMADKSAEFHLTAVANLLGVEVEGLRKALTTRTRQTFDGRIVSPLPVDAARENRDSLTKTIYSRMFDWLVERINKAIGQDSHARAVCGVLDIYGFEQFKENTFEQFCINLANEKLQQHFNQHVFKMEQIEYEKEEIDWSYIEFVDNQDVLDLIEKKPGGILDLLDEQCQFPTSTAKDFALKLYQHEYVKGHSRFHKPKLSQTAFTVDHYAGKVTYETDLFLDKNKDYVIGEHQELLSTAQFEYIKLLFPPEPEPEKQTKGPGARGKASYQFKSVGTRFKGQLGDLMKTLAAMEPHYIRCVKPNSLNKPMLFEPANVLHQLRCGGVLEAIRISCAGYPSRREFAEFVDHFWNLAPELLSLPDDRKFVQKLLAKVELTGYQLGKTKVFLKSGQMAILDKRRTEVMNAAATQINRIVRGFLERVRYKHIRQATVTLQSMVRAKAARKLVHEMRCQKNSILIQAHVRGFLAKRQFQRVRNSAIVFQAAWRGLKARRDIGQLQRQRAALCIQTTWRAYKARKAYKAHVHDITIVQNRWRMRMAKRELRRLRQEARESTKLLKDKRALEIRCQELEEIVNTVQTQRNELKQSLKEEKAQIATLRENLATITADRDSMQVQMQTAMTMASERETSLKTKLESEVERLQAENKTLQAHVEEATAAREAAERKAADDLAAAKRDLAESKQKAHASNQDLMRRLENAIKQRNDARESLTMSAERVKELEEEIQKVRKAAAESPVRQAAGRKYLANSTRAVGEDDAVSPSPVAAVVEIPEVVRASANGVESDSDASGVTDIDRKQRDLENKRQQLLKEQKAADQEKLLQCISTELGFHDRRPLAALIIFRSCLHWKSFQADRTNLFDKIIQTISLQIDQQQENNSTLSYWLTNTVTLYHLLQKNIKPASGGTHYSSVRARVAHRTGIFGTTRSGFSSFFSRSTAGASTAGASVASGASAGPDVVGGTVGQQVEAKYPALLFKQQLDAFVQKIFPMLRDNIKKEITPELAACIHAPKTGGRSVTSRRGGVAAPGGPSGTEAVHVLSSHWGNIMDVFTKLLQTLKENYVPPFLQRKLFMQLFSFVNVQLFNQLLLRRECCSFSNGEYVKRGLAELENWISNAGENCVGDSWEELRYIRQAVDFLCIHQKPRKKLEEITNDLCPVLSIQQLYRISTMYWDDKYNTETVSHAVLAKMKQMMVDNSASTSHSFLLDDDSAIPFQQEDILTMVNDAELYSELPLPPSLSDTQSFTFLMQAVKIGALGDPQSPGTPGQ